MQQRYIETRTNSRWCFTISSRRLLRVTLRDSALAALVATIWGFNFVVIDWGMAGVPPLLFVTLRFVAVVFPAVLLVPRPDAPWRSIVAVGAAVGPAQAASAPSQVAVNA